MNGSVWDPELPESGEDSKSKNRENVPIYCTCQKSEIYCLKIRCDNCNQWFHPACTRLTDKMTETVCQWYCGSSREKNPKLEILCGHQKSPDHDRNDQKVSEPQDEGGGCKRAAPDLDPECPTRSGVEGGAMVAQGSVSPHKFPLQTLLATDSQHHHQQQQITWSAGVCGECQDFRSNEEDPGHCDLCQNMRFGDPNKIGQKCPLRLCELCVRASDEYFPSSPSPVMPSESLPFPRRPLPTQHELGCIPEQEEAVASSAREATHRAESLSFENLPLDPDPYLNLCAGTSEEHGLPCAPVPTPEEGPGLGPTLQKRAENMKLIGDGGKKSYKKENRSKRRGERQKPKDKHKAPQHADAEDPMTPPQCLGPDCVRPSRPGSKYCSEDCGMKLAAKRICHILPQRIQQWQQSPCVAEERDKKFLERIYQDKHRLHTRLQEMDRRFQDLKAVIMRAKQQVVREDKESDVRDKDGTCQQIFCVSCGNPIQARVALRHMEHCYAKYERQAPFESRYPTHNEGTRGLFCDVYNPQTKTYCKQLRVLCPVHARDPKVPPDEVCGCPLLLRDVFELTGDFCPLPKRQCDSHHCWEKLLLAQVDLERVRLWCKLEELLEQERKVLRAMTHRAGVLALMLHETVQHDPLTTDLCSSVDH